MRQLTLNLLTLLSAGPALVSAAPSIPQGSRWPSPWRNLPNHIKSWAFPAQRALSDFQMQNSIEERRDTSEKPLGARYGGDMVLRFNITNEHEAAALAEASNALYLDVWEFSENWVDIRLAKDVVPLLLGLLPPSLQTSHVPLMRDIDLAHAILGSSPSKATSYDHVSYSPSLRTSNTADTDMAFRDYHPFSVIQTWMRLVSSYYSTHVRLISIGKSYEGRDIPAFRIGAHPKNNEKPSGPRKTVIISGGSHAREWISTSTVNYIAYSLMTSYGKSRTVTSLTEAFDWIFVPTLNPDGYVYTWETDRLWRKNRQPTKLSFCRGVDLDRAWSFHWDGESSRGNPCSESFAGEAPFEGDEARQFADWAKNETEHNNAKIVGFLDLHSYSQQVLYPYSYSCDAAPPTLENLEELALGLAKAMRLSRGGHNYKATSACEGNVNMEKDGRKTVLPRMETGGGSALDWFYHEMRVEYTYQIKLRDTGSYGFLLPRGNIVPTGKEVLEAVLYLGRHLLDDAGLQLADEGATKNQQDVPAVSRSEVAGGNDAQVPEQSPDDEQTRDSSDDFDTVEGMQWELKRRRR